MTARVLAAVLAVLAMAVGVHLVLMLALAVALAAVLVLAWRIDLVTMATGWGLAPGGRKAVAAW